MLRFRLFFDNYSGYGRHALTILGHLRKQGYAVAPHPVHINMRDQLFRHDVRLMMDLQQESRRPPAGELDELVCLPPGYEFPKIGRRRAWITMWETTRVPRELIANLNRSAELLIVPDAWNATVFNASGYEGRVAVCPLGIDPEVFQYRPMTAGPFVFGSGGRMVGAGGRKRLDLLPGIFQRAFPDDPDVRLHLKISPDETLPVPPDPRIEVNRKMLPDEGMADWFGGLTVYVNHSLGEGWGLFMQQAMATGRPVLGPRFSGTAEFFDDAVGLVLPGRLERYGTRPGDREYVRDDYSRNCLVSDVSEPELIEAMRRIRHQPALAEELGRRASVRARRLTLDASHTCLENILFEHGFLLPVPAVRLP